MLPRIVIADPALTVGMPPALTAAVGMDALSHNLEAFFAPGYHPLARGHRRRGRAPGQGLAARGRARAGATSRRGRTCWSPSEAGATAFQRGLGAMHALAHPLGALYGVHHGLLNAVLMPYRGRRQPPGDRGRRRLSGRAALVLASSSDDLLAWVLELSPARSASRPDSRPRSACPRTRSPASLTWRWRIRRRRPIRSPSPLTTTPRILKPRAGRRTRPAA